MPGSGRSSFLEDETLEQFERIRGQHAAPSLGMRAVIKPMRASGGGSIVNIASTASLAG